MSKTPSLQTIAKALMDRALVEPNSAVEYTGEFHPVSALRIECYRLRAVARAFENFQYDPLTFELKPDIERAGVATLVISHA